MYFKCPDDQKRSDRIIHVGWYLDLTVDLTQSILDEVKKVGIDFKYTIRKDLYTAHMYLEKQDTMFNWFRKWAGKPSYAFLRAVYATKDYLVAHIMIESIHYWIILSKRTDIPPATLKKKVSAGQLGIPIQIERIKIPVRAYWWLAC